MPEVFTHGHALLIGVGADLPVTVRDASALRDVLIDPQRAAYPPDQVELLVETNASSQHMLDAFDRLIARVNADPQATVMVYFSGHGTADPHQPSAYYLLPYGYDIHRCSETAVSAVEFTKKIEAINAGKLVVLLDCCHAAAMPMVKTPGETFAKAPVELLEMLGRGKGNVIVASSQEQEYSYYIKDKPYSVFTHCLLDALAGKAAVKKDGYARILDILPYLLEQVPLQASLYGIQRPLVKKIMNLNDNFALCYYAGGSKGIPGEQKGDAALTGKRKRLQKELEGLIPLYELSLERKNRIRLAYEIEVNPATKFQYEHQHREAQAALECLNQRMEAIEQQLEQG